MVSTLSSINRNGDEGEVELGGLDLFVFVQVLKVLPLHGKHK